MLLVLFVFKAFGFALVGFGLNFALLQPSNGYQVFSHIYLVVTKCFPSSTYWPPCHDMCVFSSRSYGILGQNYPSIFKIST